MVSRCIAYGLSGGAVTNHVLDVTDQSFDCAVNRTRGSPATQLMMVNHFLDVVSFFPSIACHCQTDKSRSIALPVRLFGSQIDLN